MENSLFIGPLIINKIGGIGMITYDQSEVKLDNNNPCINEIVEKAYNYEKQSRYDDAIKLYSAAIELLCQRRAFVNYKIGKFHDAIKDYSYLISNGISKPNYIKNRAALYKKIEEYEKCREDLLTLIKIYEEEKDYESLSVIKEQLEIVDNLINENETIMHNKATAHVKKEENRKHKTIKSVVKEIINLVIKGLKNRKSQREESKDVSSMIEVEDDKKINPVFEEDSGILKEDLMTESNIENCSQELEDFADTLITEAIDYETKESENTCSNVEIKNNFKSDNIEKINPTFIEALEILRKDWKMISRIENPSEELQEFAVNLNTRAIDYIENPCEKVLNNPFVKKYLESKKTTSYRLELPEFEEDELRRWW